MPDLIASKTLLFLVIFVLGVAVVYFAIGLGVALIKMAEIFNQLVIQGVING